MSVDIQLSADLSQAIAAIDGMADRFVEALATAARDRFRDNVHVVTGAMQASASVVTDHGSDYGESVSRAAALNPSAEFAAEAAVGAGEAVVQVPVGYAASEEFGTSRRAAHPALVPAIESVAADAEAIARTVLSE